MDRFKMLLLVALRNLRSHPLKTAVVGAIIAFGAFVLVVGLSFAESIEYAMRDAVTSSITGHLQVWSADGDDQFRLIQLGSSPTDPGVLRDFSEVEETLSSVVGVTAVVPMATGVAAISFTSETDRALERLRGSLESGTDGTSQDAVSAVRRIARTLAGAFERELRIKPDAEGIDEGLAIAREVDSDVFWERLREEPQTGLQYLETRFAPLTPDGDTFGVHYMATNPQSYARVFERLRIIEGEMIPEGRRGLLLPSRTYERALKAEVASDLDRLKKQLGDGRTIAQSSTLQSAVERMAEQSDSLVLQFDDADATALRPALQREVDSGEERLADLLRAFLRIDDENFARRYEFFYREIAPRIDLYALKPGDVVVLQARTTDGYEKSARVRFYGTFSFEGLESADIVGTRGLLDLVTFRTLYGGMSAAQLAELADLREEVGVQDVALESAEDALFGEESGPLEADAAGPDITGEIPDQLGVTERFDDAIDEGAMGVGLVQSVAVMVDDPERVDEIVAKIDQIPGLQATDWQSAAGMIGQFILVVRGVLYVAVLLIFLVAGIIINNSVLLTTTERIPEFGTIRAIGGSRWDILLMVTLESAVIAVVGGVIGAGLAVALMTGLGSVGIPSPSGIAGLFFGGDRLFPFVTVTSVLMSLLIVFLVTMLSTLYPARIAVGVPPVVAMRGTE